MATDTMKLTVSGPDVGALATAVAAWPAFQAPPNKLDIDYQDTPVTPDWLAQALSRMRRSFNADWSDASSLSVLGRCVLALSPSLDDLPSLPRLVGGLPFELAAFWTPFGGDWKAAEYLPPGFADGHIPHGWACMFKGAGHDRLCSRRWLEFGPWRLTRLPDDVSLVEFYDLAADSATALAQARAGHQRMGITRKGGFLQRPYVYANKLDGVYDAAARTYKIPVAARELKSSEMLDACALRDEKRDDPQTPISELGFVFVMGEEEAQPYLHELWARGLGCWAVVDGVDVRLDDRYTPPPRTPPW